MKDIDSKDILLRRNRRLTNVSIYRDGRWVFAGLNNLKKTSQGQNFYLMSNPFGLLKEGTQDPKIITLRGEPGDYVAIDSTGTVSMVTAEQFNQLFPAPNLDPPKTSNNSEQLKDPKFLTDILNKNKP